MPAFIAPQHPMLVTRAPRGEQWLHEIKFDGYRVQIRVQKRRPAVRTREGHDWTERFKGIVAAAKTLPDCIIDGEAVILDKPGLSDFAALQIHRPIGLSAPITGSVAHSCPSAGLDCFFADPL
jgi:bifunctional non-homologous end joining protein LigD